MIIDLTINIKMPIIINTAKINAMKIDIKTGLYYKINKFQVS